MVEIQKAVTLSAGSETTAWLAYTYATSGEKDKALEILKRLTHRAKQEYVSPIYLAKRGFHALYDIKAGFGAS